MAQFQSVPLPPRRGRGQRTRVRGAYDQAMADLEVQYLQVQTTTDSRAEAMELSRAAVESRLAACAQVAGPVASMYWWDGALERTEEWLVLLKLPAAPCREVPRLPTRTTHA